MSKSRIAINGPLGQAPIAPTTGPVTHLMRLGDVYAIEVSSPMETYELSDQVDMVTGTNDGEAIFAHGGSDSVDAGGGDDVVFGGNGYDLLIGGAGDDVLDGGAQADTVFGGNGHDILQGGSGGDEMVGGAGNDMYFVDHHDDKVVESAGEGWDVVVSTRPMDMPFAVEALRFVQTPGQAAVAFQAEGNELDNLIMGSVMNDSFEGGSGHDELNGDDGNDTLQGGPGNDTLMGGAGDDLMAGNEGNDHYSVQDPGDQVVELPGQGIDSVVTGLPTWTLGAHVEQLHFFHLPDGPASFVGVGNGLDNKIYGSAVTDTLFGLDGKDTLVGGEGDDALTGGNGDDQLLGGAGQDQLFGGAGLDLLDGGEGADVMKGGAGNDVYIVDDIADVVDESAGGGADKVHTYTSFWALPNHVEVLEYEGVGNFIGWGNTLDNTLWGWNGDDQLSGFEGKDKLVGGWGHDTLAGGNGDDDLIGGAGNDVLTGGPGHDMLNGDAGSDRFVMDHQDTKGDIIYSFEQGQDKIDLSSFDARPGVAGNQAFQFVGTGAFVGKGIGSVAYAHIDSHLTRVYVDIDGNGVSDFDFGIYNDAPLQLMGVDFIL